MAWDHLAINRPHLVYIILGGFTSLFMLCSSFIKERLYIGEATVATICGIIFGPHAANLIDPGTWGNVDQVTLEFSRIVLVVQCFAVGVELPKYYMEKHWRSVVFLLLPVMTFGWLMTSLFIWWMVPALDWLQSLACAACVTATDPVLASSVVGKGKFAKRVPKHLRDVLSAESGCNDGMAFPFIYLALYLIDYRPDADKVAFNWFVVTILYECVFGAFYGFMIGYIGRHGIKYAEKHDMVDRESFLVFYFVLALFCAGSGSILGVDDLLVGFAAGVGFSNDGWFTQKTEESHVSNVIDLLINLAYFVYLGTIIPWEQYNNPVIGLTPWRLVVLAIFVILFRRIPIMVALKPIIPDIKTWREALFAGHFGPIGVGAIFVAILARAELETGHTTPLAEYPDVNAPNYELVTVIWPITTFLVIASILVHGSSIAVFTLGKHINTLQLTMSYTQDVDGPGWLNRLPRISSTSRSQGQSYASETEGEEPKMEGLPPGALPPVGIPREFLRRQKEEDVTDSRSSSMIPRRRKKRWDDGRGPGGPISQSAIYPQRRKESENFSEQTSDTLTPGDRSPDGSPGHEKDDEDQEKESPLGEVQDDPEMHEILHRHSEDEKRDQHKSDAERRPSDTNIYREGDDYIIENADGEVISEKITSHTKERREAVNKAEKEVKDDVEHPTTAYENLRKKLGVWRHKDEPAGENGEKGKQGQRKRGPALAYQFGNTIIVEDEDGEVVKTYEIPANKQKKDPTAGGGEESSTAGAVRQGLTRMGTWSGLKKDDGGKKAENPGGGDGGPSRPRMNWGFSKNAINEGTPEHNDAEDDRHIRFMIGGAGRRLTKEDFLKEIQSLDPKARCEVVAESDASPAMKALAKKDASNDSPGSSRLFHASAVETASGKGAAKAVGAKMARERGARLQETPEVSESEDSDHQASRRPRIHASAKQDSHGTSAQANKNARMRAVSNADQPSNDVPESATERKRREQALKGVDEVTPGQRGRSRSRDDYGEDVSPGRAPEESAAEKRRRLAALGTSSGGNGGRGKVGGGGNGSGSGSPEQEDSDDDNTPRVPPPVAKSRGIRFAQSPVRGRR